MGFLLLPTAPTSFAAGVAVPVLMEKMEGRDSRCKESNKKRQDPRECIQYLITKGRVLVFNPSLHYQMLSMLGWTVTPTSSPQNRYAWRKRYSSGHPRNDVCDTRWEQSDSAESVKVTRVAEVRVWRGGPCPMAG